MHQASEMTLREPGAGLGWGYNVGDGCRVPRRGDDSAHERAILNELAIDAPDDELEGRG